MSNLTPETLEVLAHQIGIALLDLGYEEEALSHASAWEGDVFNYRVKIAEQDEQIRELSNSAKQMRGSIRSLWHAVVDGDIDRLSTSYALRDILEGK